MVQPGHAVSGVLGAVTMAALFALTGAARTPPPVLDVERINIREPDGTLRMVLSGAAREPGIIIAGREQPHPTRRSAGILFYNAEGTENGGLIFDGRRTPGGTAQSSGSLTFDRYRQDQVVQMQADEDGADRRAGLVVNDQPDRPIDFAAIQRARSLPPAQQAAALAAANAATTRRVFVGRTREGASELQLRDARGNSRLLLRVDAAGRATITFLDADGHPRRTIGA